MANGLTTKATPVDWYVFAVCLMIFSCPPPASQTNCVALKKKYECCLDIYEGRVVSLRGPFEAGMHDMTVFRGGKEEDGKENWDRDALYFKIKQGDRIVGDLSLIHI